MERDLSSVTTLGSGPSVDLQREWWMSCAARVLAWKSLCQLSQVYGLIKHYMTFHDSIVRYDMMTLWDTFTIRYLSMLTSSTAQGGGGSFKNRKPIGEIGCCESRMAERSHWWTEGAWGLLSFSLFPSLPTYLPAYLYMYLSTYLSTYLSIYLASYLPIYLSIYVAM